MSVSNKIGQFKAEIRSTYKSLDTEEYFDRIFTKPLGYIWTKIFLALHWTPNMVTIFSMVLGFAGGCFLYPKHLVWNIIGILLVIWANILDSTDGQLARITGIRSTLGRILDALSTSVWYVAIYAALALRLMNEPIPFWDGRLWGGWIWVIVAISSLLGHQPQCMMADYYRNLHLFFLNNKHGSELARSDRISAERHSVEPRKWFQRLYLFFYEFYTRAQERYTPSIQALLNGVEKRKAEGKPLDPAIENDFLTASRKYIQLSNILTFNTRAYISFICILAGVPVLYFFIEFFLGTALLVFTNAKYESIAHRIVTKYALSDNVGTKTSHIPWRIIFFLIGIVGTVFIFLRSDLDLIDWSGTFLAKMPLWLPSICLLWLTIYLIHTIVYLIIIGKKNGKVPFGQMLKITISGFAMNHVTPVGLVGGEPYRIMELKPYIGTAKAAASTLSFSIMYIISHILFWLTGGILFLCKGCPGGFASAPVVILICAFCILACLPLFTRGKNGFVLPTLNLFLHLPWIKKYVARFIEKHKVDIDIIDHEIRVFHSHPKSFWPAFLLEYAGRMLEVIEYFLIFQILGWDVSFTVCIIGLAAASLIGNAVFVIPMQIGARESGLSLSLHWFGVPVSISMTAGLMTRIRELVFLVVGLAAMLIRNHPKKRD